MSEGQSSTVLKRAKFAVGAILIVLLIGAAAVLVLRGIQARALNEATAVHAKQYVTTVMPRGGGDGQPLTLPGTLQGIIESTLYARSNGYVLHWYKDIGASVKKGDLLAEITAPEIDQELTQAQATLAQVQANARLAKSTADRWVSLRKQDAVTQQEVDERVSADKQGESYVAAAQANVERLRNLQGYNRVVVPFDGVVTRRNIDVGDLVNAGNGGVGQALFSVAQIDPLRLYVYVPQAYASQIKVGDAVTVTLAEGGDQYNGTISHTARAIDTTTRTMQVEIRVPNPKGALIAGSYVQVRLPVDYESKVLVVPTNVLLFRPSGTKIATLDRNGRVHLNAVKLGTDFGDSVAIVSGVAATDRIVVNPADSLADGDTVTLAPGQASSRLADAEPGQPERVR
jgi:RND family efflux transporter MFP subunit